MCEIDARGVLVEPSQKEVSHTVENKNVHGFTPESAAFVDTLRLPDLASQLSTARLVTTNTVGNDTVTPKRVNKFGADRTRASGQTKSRDPKQTHLFPNHLCGLPLDFWSETQSSPIIANVRAPRGSLRPGKSDQTGEEFKTPIAQLGIVTENPIPFTRAASNIEATYIARKLRPHSNKNFVKYVNNMIYYTIHYILYIILNLNFK